MKNKHVSMLTLLCALLALLLSAGAFYFAKNQPDYTGRLDALEAQNQQLLEQLEAFTATVEYEDLGEIGLQEWSLTPTVLSEINAVSIDFEAVPLSFTKGLQAELVVFCNGQVAANAPCALENGVFTASAQLPADNGYAYYCVLTDADGAQHEIPLITDESLDDLLINLADSTTIFLNLTVEDFHHEKDTLTVHDCALQLRLPRLLPDGMMLEYTRSQLVLCCNGIAADSQSVVLNPGEDADVYELILEEAVFSVPELTEGDLLELQLEATLSDGMIIVTSGTGWFWENGTLIHAAG